MLSSKAIIRRLRSEGWEQVGQKGSHVQFKHPHMSGRITVPHPRKDFPVGTLRSIFQAAGWAWPPRHE